MTFSNKGGVHIFLPTASAHAQALSHLSTLSLGPESPQNTTSGLSISLPHALTHLHLSSSTCSINRQHFHPTVNK